MNRIISRLIVVCLTGLLMVCNSRGQSAKPLRVLVDSSKDGGLWWFPQGPNFDSHQHHQGKSLADFMRGLGWKVLELPRGEVITFDKLRDFDLVIRPPAYFNYSADEVLAYQQSVTAGTRLLLMGGTGKGRDVIAEIFGLDFETRSIFGPVKQWIPHGLTANINCCSLPWTAISEMPPGAIALAWLNQAGTNSRPVLGYLPYGKGSVVFVGQALITRASSRAFSESLIMSAALYGQEEIDQLPMGAPVSTDESVELGPRLTAPASEAMLPQPNFTKWRFDWEDVPAATSYEIVVLGPAAAFPLVQAISSTSDYVASFGQGYVIDSNLRGWTWRVRAQYQNGTWSPWSRIRRFNVKPKSF